MVADAVLVLRDGLFVVMQSFSELLSQCIGETLHSGKAIANRILLTARREKADVF